MKYFCGLTLLFLVSLVPHAGAGGRIQNVGSLVRFFETSLAKEYFLETEKGREALMTESRLLPESFRSNAAKEFPHLSPLERDLKAYLQGLHLTPVRKRSIALYRDIEVFAENRKLFSTLRNERALQVDPFNVDKVKIPQSELLTEFSEANQSLGKRTLRELFSELKQDVSACMNSRPNHSLSTVVQMNWRQALWAVGYSEMMTVSSYITATGVKKVSARDLGFAMATSGLSAAAGPFLLSSTNDLSVRYFRGVAFGEGRAAFDFVFYAVGPESSQRDFEKFKVDPVKRLGFNAGWEAGAALLNVSIHTLLSMVECLHPTTQVFRSTYGLRAVSSWGMGFVYFGYWNRFKKDQYDASSASRFDFP